MATLVAEAGDSLRCQDSPEGEGVCEEIAGKDSALAEEAEPGDSILSADATHVAAGGDEEVDSSAAEARMSSSATCSVSQLTCSCIVDDVAYPPETGSQALMQPPPFDNPLIAGARLTAAVAEFNSLLAQVTHETLSFPLALQARSRVQP